MSLTASASTVGSVQECDLANDPEAICAGGVVLTYDSQFVTTQTSVPGRSRQEIWIDCGAIVGAVQFFAWFLLVFFQE
jgi:hypothetical protein